MEKGDHVKPRPASSVKFTYDDFVNFPDDGKRHELIDGEHYVTPSPSTKHQAVSGNLHGLLWMHLRQHPSGAVFHAPFDVVFSRFDVVEPDLLFVSQPRIDILTSANVQGSPDLVVEILSPGTRRIDEITKRKRYETFGVHEYWVVDPELDTIKVYRRSEDAFEKVSELTAERDDVLTTPLVPGWSARLSDVFASPV